jgi:hypothetical protein
MGIYGVQDKKGAERLMAGTSPTPGKTTNFNLNVELKQDGGPSIIPNTNKVAPVPAK